MTRTKAIVIAVTVAMVAPVALMAQSFINSFVAVCDPASPSRCIKPTSAGAIAIGSVAPNTGAPTVTAVTVGTGSAQAVAAGAFKYFFIQNVSASANIACRWAGTAAINTAGSFLLAPGMSRTFEQSFVPNAALNCIASAASTQATVETF